MEPAVIADALDSILESARTATNMNAVGLTLPPWIGLRRTEFPSLREASCKFDYTTNDTNVNGRRRLLAIDLLLKKLTKSECYYQQSNRLLRKVDIRSISPLTNIGKGVNR